MVTKINKQIQKILKFKYNFKLSILLINEIRKCLKIIDTYDYCNNCINLKYCTEIEEIEKILKA